MGTTVNLLGPPKIITDGQPLELPPGKTSALLYYLAQQSTWVPREDLLFLFWPDKEEARGRSNLRQLLTTIRRLEQLEDVQIERSRVRWQVPTDLHAFHAAITNEQTHRAVESYGGPLLDGFRLLDAPEFESWLELERDTLHQTWRDASTRYAGILREASRFEEAVGTLERLVDADPLDEQAFRALLTTLAENGRRTEAIRRFETFKERLQDELGVEPETGTLQVVRALREAPPINPGRSSPLGTSEIRSPHRETSLPMGDERLIPVEGPRPSRPTRKLPTPSTPFIGRKDEHRELRTTLQKSSTSLVTIVGPGGMGKTRLAIAVARSLVTTFADGAALVPFAATEGPDQMEAVLAENLDFSFSGKRDPRHELLGFLANKELLLVLDNLEQLTRDLSLLTDILEQCPHVKLLATSRERLNLRSERVYDLTGLRYPRSGADNLHTYDAVALFLETGRRVNRQLDERGVDLSLVAELCRMVQGMPLALTLAAAWLRVLSVQEVVHEIDQGLDLLQGEEHDLPDRHRSIRTVFETTWQQLSPKEREAWARLSIFQGGFTREAATVVAEVTLPLLLLLTNKALITREAGRFYLHPLVAKYGREQAKSLGFTANLRARHAEYYTDLMQQLGEALKGAEQMDALSKADQEFPNILAAWQSSLELPDLDRVIGTAFPLARYYGSRMLHGQGPATFDRAVEQLDGLPITPRQQIALARTLLHASGAGTEALRCLEIAGPLGDTFATAEAHGRLCGRGDVSDARAHFEASSALFDELTDEDGTARASLAFGWHLAMVGLYDESRHHFQQALDRFQRLGNAVLAAEALDRSAVLHGISGDLAQSEELALRAGAIYRDLHLELRLADTYLTLGWAARMQGEFQKAESYIEAYIASGVDDAHGIALQRAELYYSKKDYDRAVTYAQEALAIHRKHGARNPFTARLLLRLGRIAIRQHDLRRARALLLEAFEIAVGLSAPSILLETAATAAELFLHQGDQGLAMELVAVVRQHPATDIESRREIEALSRDQLPLKESSGNHDLEWIESTLVRMLS